jgi:Flp pilus assembly protein TadG
MKTLAKPTREKGQGLVEFAFMGMFLLVLMMGILDLGRLYFTYLALKDAASEGAYFASAYPECPTAGAQTGCSDNLNVDYRVRNSAPGGGLVDWSDTTNAIITVTPLGSIEAGQSIQVTVRYGYKMITPFVGGGRTLTLQADSVAVIIRVPNCSVSPCQ